MPPIQTIRKKAKEDLYFFCKEILNYSKMRPNPHKELTDFLVDPHKRKKLILMPRGSYKSSVVTVGSSLWALVNNPDLRILISHELQKNAIKYVKEIRTHIEQNAKFRALFGDWVNKRNTWRDHEFIIKPRKANLKEPTIMAGSLEKGVTVGLHFDRIVLDDPVSISNTQSHDQIEKTIEYYKLLLSVLEPGGTLIVIGTRWNLDDLYGFLIAKEKDNFDIFIRKAVDDDGTFLMPDILSKEFLEEVRTSQGEEIFNHQYLNNPVIKQDQAFDMEDLRYFEKVPNDLYYFITIDAAISQKKYADFTGFVVNGVDYNNNYYVVEAIKAKMKPYETIELLFQMLDKYQPVMAVGLETNSLDQVLKNLIMEEMGKRNKWVALADVKIDTRIRKEDRIRWLQMKLRNHQLHVKKTQTDLLEELERYPQVRHDDLLDALKSQLKITYPSDKIPKALDPLKQLSYKEEAIWRGVNKLGSRKIVRMGKWKRI